MKWRMKVGKCWLCGQKMPGGSYCGADCPGPRGWRSVRYAIIHLLRLEIS